MRRIRNYVDLLLDTTDEDTDWEAWFTRRPPALKGLRNMEARLREELTSTAASEETTA